MAENYSEAPLPLHGRAHGSTSGPTSAKKTKLQEDAGETPASTDGGGGGDLEQLEDETVEVVESDEFDFLDGVTRLATLEAGIAI